MSERAPVERFWQPQDAAFAQTARDWVLAGRPAGIQPRRASTVMLLRDGSAGVEVFMMRRVASMAFAPSMWVFPGGGVDDRDTTDLPAWAGPSPSEWADRLEEDESVAASLVVAAAREVFEESGVLLASRGDELVTADEHPQAADDRAALLDRRWSFSQMLRERGMTLRTDLLQVQDHWITPEFEPRRYDTWFFAALMPQSQSADDLTTESEISRWVRPTDLLADLASGVAMMLPPTELQLERIAATSAAAQAALVERRLMPVMPVPEIDADDADVVQLRTRYYD